MSPVVNPDGSRAGDEPQPALDQVLARRAKRERAVELAGLTAPSDQATGGSPRTVLLAIVAALAVGIAALALLLLL